MDHLKKCLSCLSRMPYPWTRRINMHRWLLRTVMRIFPTRTPPFPVDLLRFPCAFRLFPAIARIASSSPAAATTCIGDSGSAGAGKEYHGKFRCRNGRVHSRACQLRHRAHPSGYGLSYVVPEMSPLSFDIFEHMFTNALQGHQQEHRAHLPIAAPVAVPWTMELAARKA